ncbi:putative transposase protein [Fulvimarina pelagi HTCC2506]|uniref:Putative transposase protein n=1 Tax=Fulvimarina pelagi HTCC2506 TaxID=314231 RepID=Q0G390_9HYPH|nr:putative transposase protein [Fulvimarina pelagi HTCC2506]
MMQRLLKGEGFASGRRHVATLMKWMGSKALYRRPNTSKPAPAHKFYPYLLRKLAVTRLKQVWAMDITYIPMRRRFVYLAAFVDWFSQRDLAGRLSITLHADSASKRSRRHWRGSQNRRLRTRLKVASFRATTSWQCFRRKTSGF